MMKKPKRIAIIGIDGAGKTALARKLLKHEKGNKTAMIRLAKYDRSNKVFSYAGKFFDKLIETGEKKKSPWMIAGGYMGHDVLFAPYRLVKEKGKEKVYFSRYPIYDIEALSEVYAKGKLSGVLKKVLKFASGAPKPDSVIFIEIPPEIAKRRIDSRAARTGRKVQSHENLESLIKMDKAFRGVVEKLKKGGTPVFTVDALKR